jgi:hypothetical protein
VPFAVGNGTNINHHPHAMFLRQQTEPTQPVFPFQIAGSECEEDGGFHPGWFLEMMGSGLNALKTTHRPMRRCISETGNHRTSQGISARRKPRWCQLELTEPVKSPVNILRDVGGADQPIPESPK